MPASSLSSLSAHCHNVSPLLRNPPGMAHIPLSFLLANRILSVLFLMVKRTMSVAIEGCQNSDLN